MLFKLFPISLLLNIIKSFLYSAVFPSLSSTDIDKLTDKKLTSKDIFNKLSFNEYIFGMLNMFAWILFFFTYVTGSIALYKYIELRDALIEKNDEITYLCQELNKAGKPCKIIPHLNI
jgi:hypothetical protein